MLEPDARAGDLLGGPDVRFGSKADIGTGPLIPGPMALERWVIQ